VKTAGIADKYGFTPLQPEPQQKNGFGEKICRNRNNWRNSFLFGTYRHCYPENPNWCWRGSRQNYCFGGLGVGGLIAPVFSLASFKAVRFPTPLPMATDVRMSLKLPLIGGIIFCGLLMRVLGLRFYRATVNSWRYCQARWKTRSAFHPPYG